MYRILILLTLMVYTTLCNDSELKQLITKAEVQSCSGCSLSGLPEVKKFIFEDVPLYENVVYKNIQRAPPELVLYTEEYKEMKRIPLKSLTRKECNSLLQDWGFERRHKNEL